MDIFITFIQFVALGLSLAAPIGPMNIEVMKRGLTEGFLSSWFVGLGGLSGDVLLLLSIYYGFANYMELFFVKMLMYLVGTAVLAFIGVTSVQSAFRNSVSVVSDMVDSKKQSNPFLTGFVLAVANPISLIFWFAVYGTSLQTLTSTYSPFIALVYSFGIIVGLFLWNLNIVFTVYFSKKIMNTRLIRVITFAAGVCLLGFSLYFLRMVILLVIG